MSTNETAPKTQKSNGRYFLFSIPIILVSFFFLGSSTTTKHCENCHSQKQKVSRAFGLTETDIVLRAGKNDCEHNWQSAGTSVEAKKQG